jgi:hypothetical protein
VKTELIVLRITKMCFVSKDGTAISIEDIEITDEIIRENFKLNAQVLWIRDCTCTDEVFEHMTSMFSLMINLRDLSITSLPMKLYRTKLLVNAVSHLPLLNWLDLNRNKINLESARVILTTKFQALEDLTLDDNEIDDVDGDILCKVPATLDALRMRNNDINYSHSLVKNIRVTRFDQIYASDNKLCASIKYVDFGMSQAYEYMDELAALNDIELLWLKECDISVRSHGRNAFDQLIDGLKQFPNLKTIIVTRCKIRSDAPCILQSILEKRDARDAMADECIMTFIVKHE